MQKFRPRVYLNEDKGDNVESLIMRRLIPDDVWHYWHTDTRWEFDKLGVRIENSFINFPK